MAFGDNGWIGKNSRRRALGDGVAASGLGGGIKRAFDIIAGIASLILASPVILIVSMAIKLDSRGPIFSRETLYGYKNRPIVVLKFRSTMACPERDQTNFRATRVGRVLRQAGIDQLPRLFNVLVGEMSIVGPHPYARPHDLFEKRLVPLLDGVKPGLTGWAQFIESRQGLRTTDQRINDDLYYVENWSLSLDIKIVLMTLFSSRSHTDI